MNKNLTIQQIDDINNFEKEVLILYPNGVSEHQTLDERLIQITKAQYYDLLKSYILEDNKEAINKIINLI